jgi:phasin family protein
MTASKSKIVEMTTAAESAASKSVEAAVEAGVSPLKQGVGKAMKTAEALVAFSHANMEAVMKSSQIWVSGVQDLSRHMAAAAQASLDDGMSAFKALSGVKSVKDAFELQSSFARSALEKSVAESGKLTDASFKLTEQALAPIAARVTVAVEKFGKAG